MEIKIGDYIEGKEKSEILDTATDAHKSRIVVEEIEELDNGNFKYKGKSDDELKGIRIGIIDTSLGEVKIITDEKPFTTDWWLLDKKTLVREWKAFDLARREDGSLYRIIGTGVNTQTGKNVIIYKNADNTGMLWVLESDAFEAEADNKEIQEWKFEKVDEQGNIIK